MATRPALIVRDFTDAGTGESFTVSDNPAQIEVGAFGNYLAAGLVTDPDVTADEAPPAPVAS